MCHIHRDGLLGHPGLFSYFYDNLHIKAIATICKEKAEGVKFQETIDKLNSLEAETSRNEAEANENKIFTWQICC